MPDNMDDIFKKKFSDFESEPFLETKEKVFSHFYEEKPENGKAIVKIVANTKRRSYSTFAIAASIVVMLMTVVGYLLNSGYKAHEKEVVIKEVRKNEVLVPIDLQKDLKKSENTTALDVKNQGNGKGTVPTNAYAIVKYKTEEKKQVIVLPDSSKAFLNKYSEISCPAKFDKENRRVLMEGEVYFEVRKIENRPFVVDTKNASIEVLGTSFCVKQFPQGQVEVTVESGKVLFMEKGSKKPNELVLTKGKKGFLEPGKPILKMPSEQVNHLSWKTEKLVFRKSPLKEVIEEVGSYFDVNIQIEDPKMLNCHFTGRFEQPGSLEEVLDVISLSIHGSYEIKNKEYVLTSKGCN